MLDIKLTLRGVLVIFRPAELSLLKFNLLEINAYPEIQMWVWKKIWGKRIISMSISESVKNRFLKNSFCTTDLRFHETYVSKTHYIKYRNFT